MNLGWPLYANMDEDQLKSLCRAVLQDEIKSLGGSSTGPVLGTFSSRGATELYAELTAREAIVVPDDEIIEALQIGPSVVVTDLSSISLELLDRITDPLKTNCTAGLVTAPKQHLVKRALATAMSLHLLPPHAPM